MSEFDLNGVASEDTNGLVYNLSSVEESTSFEVLPKGTYGAVIDSIEFGESKSSGNPMITTVYSITDGEYAERKIYDWMVLGGDAAKFGLAKLKKFLVRVCPEVSLDGFNPQVFCDEGVAIGRACRIALKIQTQKQGDYKGEKRNTVSDILEPDNAGSFL